MKRTLRVISVTELESAKGAQGWGAAIKAGGKTVFKKVLLPITVGSAVISAGRDGYIARVEGGSVMGAIGAGVSGAVKDVTEYDLWGPSVFGK